MLGQGCSVALRGPRRGGQLKVASPPVHGGSLAELAPTWVTPAVQRVSRPGCLVLTLLVALQLRALPRQPEQQDQVGPGPAILGSSRQALVYFRLVKNEDSRLPGQGHMLWQTEPATPTPRGGSRLWGFGEGHRARLTREPERGVPLLLALQPPLHAPLPGSRDWAAVPFQLLQMKLATSSSTATSRWTAPRTSTSPAPWSSTGGPWTCTRQASSTSWPRGPPPRA